MRILMLTEFFPRSDRAEITGGVEARCFYVSRELRSRHDVKVLAVRTDGAVWDHASMSSLPRRIGFLADILVRGLLSEADIVEGNNQLVHPLAWLVGRLRRRPVVHWYADVLLGSWRNFGTAGWLGEIVERVSLRLRAHHYIAISYTVAAKLTAAGIPIERVTVIPCGVDHDLAAAVRAERLEASATICVVSRLLRYKRVDLIIEAFARLVHDGRDLTMRIIGQGPEEAALREQATRLGVSDRVQLIGHVAGHRDVLRHISSSTLFVTASSVEGFGIVVTEAMALGVPYVASDIPTFVEVTKEGIGGLLFRSGDAGHLAATIGRLLDDEALRAQSSRAGLEWSKQYAWADVAEQTADIYEEVVQRGREQARSVRRKVKPLIALGAAGAVAAKGPLGRRLLRRCSGRRTRRTAH